jgi:hypothetical protein
VLLIKGYKTGFTSVSLIIIPLATITFPFSTPQSSTVTQTATAPVDHITESERYAAPATSIHTFLVERSLAQYDCGVIKTWAEH